MLHSNCITKNKMEKLVERWESLAQQDLVYAKGYNYAAMQSVLKVLAQSDSSEQLKLDLRGNQPALKATRLEDKDVAIMCSALEELVLTVNVTSLDLSYNSLTEQGMIYLASYLKVPGCSLSSLRLSYNYIKSEGVEHLCHAFLVNTSLREVDLEGCKMTSKGGLQLASTMQVNTNIQCLKLASTDLDTDCIIAMATILHANCTLQVLDLSRPILFSHQEETARHLSSTLKMNVGLSALHLSKHGLTDTGLEWMCKALTLNKSLTILDISCNKLSRDGARHIAKVLGVNHPLKELVLSYNRIQDEGLVCISSAITANNTNLQRLNVDYNSIGDVGLCALAVALGTNATLQHITIWGNQIKEPTSTAFLKLLDSGRLSADNVDVSPYEVDSTNFLALA